MLRRSSHGTLTVAAIGMAIAIAVGIGYWFWYRQSPAVLQAGANKHAAPASAASSQLALPQTMAGLVAVEPKSVAVLPFENMSADPDNGYFAEGMQDMILTKLADMAI